MDNDETTSALLMVIAEREGIGRTGAHAMARTKDPDFYDVDGCGQPWDSCTCAHGPWPIEDTPEPVDPESDDYAEAAERFESALYGEEGVRAN